MSLTDCSVHVGLRLPCEECREVGGNTSGLRLSPRPRIERVTSTRKPVRGMHLHSPRNPREEIEYNPQAQSFLGWLVAEHNATVDLQDRQNARERLPATRPFNSFDDLDVKALLAYIAEGEYDRYEAYRYEASKDNPRTALLEELSPGYAAPVRVIA